MMLPPDSAARRRLGLAFTVGATALLVALLGATPSCAHQDTRASAVTATASVTEWPGLPGGTNGGGLLLAALAAGIGFGLRRPRRVAAGLVILLPVLAFEAGLHSVHHVGAPHQAAACAVGVATAHLAGNVVEVVTVDPIAAPSLHTALPAPSAPVALHRPSPHEGRAPPASTV